MSLFLLDRDSCSHCLVGAGAGVLPCRLPLRHAIQYWQNTADRLSHRHDHQELINGDRIQHYDTLGLFLHHRNKRTNGLTLTSF